GLDRLAEMQPWGPKLVLVLREDYLGIFRSRVHERPRLLNRWERVGPLTVGELTHAVCKTAAAGEPRQPWDPKEIRGLMLQVRMPGELESDNAQVQAAFGQIVCRRLWEQWAAGGGSAAGAVEAEAIMKRYLEATLEGLGPLKEAARRLLEEHLIDR